MTMAGRIELYLVRHAIAAERGPDYPDDRLRPLTGVGARRFRQAVRGLASFGLPVDIILSSPLTRAMQTAELLAQGLPGRTPIDLVEALAPGGKMAAVIDAVSRHARTHARIVLVGHEPDLGELAAKLLGAKGGVEFRKGAMCALDVDRATPGGPGTLRWLMPPRVLRRLAP